MTAQYFPPLFVNSQLQEKFNNNAFLNELPDLFIVLSGNRNCFVLKSENTTTGQATESQFKIDGDIFEGDSISLTSQIMGPLELEAKDAPGLLQFATTATAGTTQEVAESAARALNDSVIFNRYYFADAYIGGGIIRVTATAEGSRLILIQNHSGNITQVSTVLGINDNRGQGLDNYGVYMELFTGGGDSFGLPIDKTMMVPVATVEKKLQPNNCMEIDLSGLLDNSIEVAPYSNVGLQATFKPLTPWVGTWGESFSTDGQFRKKFLIGTSRVRWALKGAQPHQLYDWQNFGPYVVTKGATEICFLTNQPITKQITRDAVEHLSLIFKAEPAVYIRYAIQTITPIFRDGTSGPEQVLFLNNIFKGGVWQFNSSPSVLPLDSIEAGAGKTLRYYDIKIRYATNATQTINPLTAPVVSKVQRYELAVRCFDSPIELIFINQWGCWDGVELLGDNTPIVKRQASEFIKSIPCKTESNDFLRGSKNIKIEVSTKAFTTWIDEASFNWITELAASGKVLQVNGAEQVAKVVNSILIRKDKSTEKFFAEIELSDAVPYNILEL